MRQSKVLVWSMSAAAGFVSLGMEITWMRVAGFQDGNTPQVFGQILGLFLLGIVFGAMLGKRLSQKAGDEAICARYGATALLLGGAVDCLTPGMLASIGQSAWTFPSIALLVVTTATLKAIAFPIVHHLGSDVVEGATGRSVSRVYFCNIIGSSVAPLMVGFVALDVIGSEKTMLALGCAAIGLALFWLARASKYPAYWPVGVAAGFLLLVLGWGQESMLHGLAQTQGARIDWFQENRHGVIHTLLDPNGTQLVMGGNEYDGRMTTDLVQNVNMIHRAYWLAALHPSPQRVLVIGFAGGAWTEVLRHIPSVRQIDVVEINRGYMDLVIEKAPYGELFNDPRIKFHLDDGRRWLRANPEETFDLIVMNNTFHWRAYSTNLLSVEFMNILSEHMARDGVLAFNATGSPDALATAAAVFPHAFRWSKSNFIYAGKADFRKFNFGDARERLMNLAGSVPGADHHASADLERAVQKMLPVNAGNSSLEADWVSASQQAVLTGRPLEVITDRNMIVEYRYGRGSK